MLHMKLPEEYVEGFIEYSQELDGITSFDLKYRLKIDEKKIEKMIALQTIEYYKYKLKDKYISTEEKRFIEQQINDQIQKYNSIKST